MTKKQADEILKDLQEIIRNLSQPPTIIFLPADISDPDHPTPWYAVLSSGLDAQTMESDLRSIVRKRALFIQGQT